VKPGEQNLDPDTEGTCLICGRCVGEGRLTRHHLLPRSVARRMRSRKMARRELRGRNPAQTVALCRPCHRNVHASLSNGDLERGYDTLEALSSHPQVRKFTEWVQDKPHGRL
jgi:5-methylcytosine-specific restriction endonuclease McrA